MMDKLESYDGRSLDDIPSLNVFTNKDLLRYIWPSDLWTDNSIWRRLVDFVVVDEDKKIVEFTQDHTHKKKFRIYGKIIPHPRFEDNEDPKLVTFEFYSCSVDFGGHTKVNEIIGRSAHQDSNRGIWLSVESSLSLNSAQKVTNWFKLDNPSRAYKKIFDHISDLINTAFKLNDLILGLDHSILGQEDSHILDKRVVTKENLNMYNCKMTINKLNEYFDHKLNIQTIKSNPHFFLFHLKFRFLSKCTLMKDLQRLCVAHGVPMEEDSESEEDSMDIFEDVFGHGDIDEDNDDDYVQNIPKSRPAQDTASSLNLKNTSISNPSTKPIHNKIPKNNNHNSNNHHTNNKITKARREADVTSTPTTPISKFQKKREVESISEKSKGGGDGKRSGDVEEGKMVTSIIRKKNKSDEASSKAEATAVRAKTEESTVVRNTPVLPNKSQLSTNFSLSHAPVTDSSIPTIQTRDLLQEQSQKPSNKSKFKDDWVRSNEEKRRQRELNLLTRPPPPPGIIPVGVSPKAASAVTASRPAFDPYGVSSIVGEVQRINRLPPPIPPSPLSSSSPVTASSSVPAATVTPAVSTAMEVSEDGMESAVKYPKGDQTLPASMTTQDINNGSLNSNSSTTAAVTQPVEIKKKCVGWADTLSTFND